MIHLTIPAFDFEFRRKGQMVIQRNIVDGYYSQGKVRNFGNPRLRRYVAWKAHVQECAMAAGLHLPLEWHKDHPVYVYVKVYFASGVHTDPENARKGVVDALCYTSKAEQKVRKQQGLPRIDDKFVAGAHSLPCYDKENPRAEIWIYEEDEFEQYLNKIREEHG